MKSPFWRSIKGHPVSHPSRGAWIEILGTSDDLVKGDGRTPRGVRGLKSQTLHIQGCPKTVAPLAGCVD